MKKGKVLPKILPKLNISMKKASNKIDMLQCP